MKIRGSLDVLSFYRTVLSVNSLLKSILRKAEKKSLCLIIGVRIRVCNNNYIFEKNKIQKKKNTNFQHKTVQIIQVFILDNPSGSLLLSV